MNPYEQEAGVTRELRSKLQDRIDGMMRDIMVARIEMAKLMNDEEKVKNLNKEWGRLVKGGPYGT